jgi:hypothetical protein
MKTTQPMSSSTRRALLYCPGALLGPLLLAVSAAGCSSVVEAFETTNNALNEQAGDPCVAQDEQDVQFGGWNVEETTIDDTPGECGPGVCVVTRFQGRVTCPEGQVEGGQGCFTPLGESVVVPVAAELEDHPAARGSFCSCRCDGPAGEGPFCGCPNDMHCEQLVADVTAGNLAGSYCVP